VIEFYDLIRNIEKRPAMYLGQPSISHLSSFLAGYHFARHQLGIPETQQEQHFAIFQEWVQQRFKINSSQSWEKIILFFSQDEHHALTQFFILFNEFSQVEIKSDVSHSVSSVPSSLAS
jgi:hypothetical protein